MIVVFGSLNVDLVTRVPKIPAPGETVKGPSYLTLPGGKGANQALAAARAVAAARAGGTVAMVGAVGDDGFAPVALAGLTEAGVDVSGVRRLADPTGAAFIAVDEEGENAITVASGANAAARAEWLEGMLDAVKPGILLVQREVPDAEVVAALTAARARGWRTVLNAAPADGFPRGLIENLSILIVNEHEAAIVARALGLAESEPDDIARILDARHGVATVVTLGGDGALGWTGGVRRRIAAPKVTVVDTTGAGDAFCGAFVAALDRGLHFGGALERGIIAGSLACTRLGAQSASPSRDEIEALVVGA